MTLNKAFDEYYEKTYMQGGSTCCPGCGGPIFWRHTLEIIGPKTIVYGGGPCAGCASRMMKLPTFGIRERRWWDIRHRFRQGLRSGRTRREHASDLHRQ